MIIYDKKSYSFSLPNYLGDNYVIVDVVYPNDIHEITFYTPSGQHLLFSMSVNSQSLKLLNDQTLAYIQARIKNETI